MVAMVEGLDHFEMQERVVGLYDILPSNAILLVAIDRDEDSEREKFFHLNNSQSTSFTVSSR